MKALPVLKKCLAAGLPAAALLFSGCIVEEDRQSASGENTLAVGAAAAPYRLGVKRDSRTTVAAKVAAVEVKASLATKVDLTAQVPPPGDQGSQGSCVGWAVAYAAKSGQEVKEEAWNRTSSRHHFSPSYVYNQINGGTDGGSVPSDALNLVVNQGVDNLESFPYSAANFTNKPDALSKARASRYKAASWSVIRNVVADLKTVLSAGNPVVVALAVYPDLDNLSSTNDTYNTIGDPSQLRGYHAMTLVGYDDAKQAFKFINSWGTGWGLSGYGWLAYGLIGNSRLELDCYRINDKANVKGFTKADHVRASGDVNGDGRQDIVAFGNDGAYVSLATGTGFQPAQIWRRSMGKIHGWTGAYNRVIADVNGDGRGDVVGFGHNDVLVALSTGTSFNAEQIWTGSFGVSDGWDAKTTKTAADVNGDGRADIVAFGYGDVLVALSTGAKFNPEQIWSNSFGINDGWDVKTTKTVADVNNDGRADVVAFGYNDVLVATSTGAKFNAEQIWTNSFGILDGWDDKTVKTVADVNNDKRADIVAFGYGDVLVGVNNGTRFNAEQIWTGSFGINDGWDAANTVKLAGDVTGDGRADVLGFGYNDFLFAQSTGAKFNPEQIGVSRNYARNSNEWHLP